jgi:hypothetical protein
MKCDVETPMPLQIAEVAKGLLDLSLLLRRVRGRLRALPRVREVHRSYDNRSSAQQVLRQNIGKNPTVQPVGQIAAGEVKGGGGDVEQVSSQLRPRLDTRTRDAENAVHMMKAPGQAPVIIEDVRGEKPVR